MDIRNDGKYVGKEVVQLYVNDLIASTSRPLVELKGFQKVSFQPGEQKTVTFPVSVEQLKYYNADLKYDWDGGDFEISIAPNSRDLQTVKVHWDK